MLARLSPDRRLGDVTETEKVWEDYSTDASEGVEETRPPTASVAATSSKEVKPQGNTAGKSRTQVLWHLIIRLVLFRLIFAKRSPNVWPSLLMCLSVNNCGTFC